MQTTLLGRQVTAEGLGGAGTIVGVWIKQTWDYYAAHVLVEERSGRLIEFRTDTVTLVPPP